MCKVSTIRVRPLVIEKFNKVIVSDIYFAKDIYERTLGRNRFAHIVIRFNFCSDISDSSQNKNDINTLLDHRNFQRKSSICHSRP